MAVRLKIPSSQKFLLAIETIKVVRHESTSMIWAWTSRNIQIVSVFRAIITWGQIFFMCTPTGLLHNTVWTVQNRKWYTNKTNCTKLTYIMWGVGKAQVLLVMWIKQIWQFWWDQFHNLWDLGHQLVNNHREGNYWLDTGGAIGIF